VRDGAPIVGKAGRRSNGQCEGRSGGGVGQGARARTANERAGAGKSGESGAAQQRRGTATARRQGGEPRTANRPCRASRHRWEGKGLRRSVPTAPVPADGTRAGGSSLYTATKNASASGLASDSATVNKWTVPLTTGRNRAAPTLRRGHAGRPRRRRWAARPRPPTPPRVCTAAALPAVWSGGAAPTGWRGVTTRGGGGGSRRRRRGPPALWAAVAAAAGDKARQASDKAWCRGWNGRPSRATGARGQRGGGGVATTRSRRAALFPLPAGRPWAHASGLRLLWPLGWRRSRRGEGRALAAQRRRRRPTAGRLAEMAGGGAAARQATRPPALFDGARPPTTAAAAQKVEARLTRVPLPHHCGI